MLTIFSHKGTTNQNPLTFHLTDVRIAIIKNTNNNSCSEDAGKKEPLYTAMKASATTLENNMEAS
jgi:hypothetical protein